jgi:LuxR family maltose regulon positive regulatory protein
MEGRDDVADFVARFTGNDRYIVDYLVEEVLQRLPDEIRMFLLDTCILERLNGSLCDAVAGRSKSKAMLGALERRNLFVVPLDDQRRWYRYHHLFADVLQAHLEDEQPERAPELHRRASEWYEREGEWTEAIRHALAARDFERTAELVEGALPAIRMARQETALLSWVEALPDGLVRRRPVLSVGFAGALLATGELSGVEGRLDDAERQVMPLTGDDGAASSARAAEIAFVDEGELRRVPGQIQMYRGACTAGYGAGYRRRPHGAGRGRRLSGHRLLDWRRPRSGSSGMERVRRGARAGGTCRGRTWGHPCPG